MPFRIPQGGSLGKGEIRMGHPNANLIIGRRRRGGALPDLKVFVEIYFFRVPGSRI